MKKDLTGQVFGRLTVLRKLGTGKWGHSLYECECSCENRTKINVDGSSLTRGNTSSCGCVRKEQSAINAVVNGRANAPTYKAFGMEKYSGEWVKYAEEKFNNKISRGAFFQRLNNGWSMEEILTVPMGVGRRPQKHSAFGMDKTMEEWVEYANIEFDNPVKLYIVHNRIYRGWSLEKALKTPIRKRNCNAKQ